MAYINKILLLLSMGLITFISCGEKNKEAKAYLENIHALHQSGNYEEAKTRIDSLQILYPKAFDQIRESMALLQDVRMSENQERIAFCNSAIEEIIPQIDSIKQYFVFLKNKDYQEIGNYVPKTHHSDLLLNQTTIRSGVNEEGQLYLESLFIGGTQYHNQIKVATKEGLSAETFPVDDDGLNFRFTDSGKQYEVIKFAGSDENGVAAFIFANANQPITATLAGKNTYSFTLSNNLKKGIGDSYQLSMMMLELDSLRSVKEKSELLIDYLKSRKQNNTEEQ